MARDERAASPQGGFSDQGAALGTDYATAKARCDELLNPQFDAWRRREETTEVSRPIPGSFDWMVFVYRSSPRFQRLPVKTKRDYDRALHMVTSHALKDNRSFGQLSLNSITPGAADRLHQRILDGGKGGRIRTAKLCMDVCRRAWQVAHREKPTIVPTENPFARMGISYRASTTRAATYDEMMKFVTKADELGYSSISTAAMIGFFLLQRAEDIFMRLAWSHYRPADAPDIIRVFHHKTGETVEVPLFDEDGSDLFPELVARLEAEPRRGSLIVMRDTSDSKRKVHLPWSTSASNPLRHVQRVVRSICEAAELSNDITFTSFRHGGHTDAANAGLSDAQIRALSGHRTAQMVPLYAKRTRDQRREGARKRLESRRTQGGHLSE